MCYNSKRKQSSLIIPLNGSMGKLRRLSQEKGQQLKN